MYSQIDNIGSQPALDVFQTLKERIDDRRVIEIVALMKYLLNPASINNSIKKSDMLKTAKGILKRLHPIQAETNDIIEANTTQINNTTELSNLNLVPSKSLMLDELRKSTRKSTTNKILEDDFHFLAKEFSLFESTCSKSSNLQLLEQSLYTIPPTSVEAKRAFSAAGLSTRS
ncbi:hypothetical protein LOD99_5272 [Oopsacas minuta]|uniref:HAT C-terminal dimerisation domain-containing protein n=1 Tax=Oopsacas minuta TaxID=111878 RepID=A0AAV7JQY4_9METZ|nr:hypothetical protein LOD99_5272 [Oopsacas minuta]